MVMTKQRILAWDVETSLNLAGIFQTGSKVTVPFANVQEYSCIICASMGYVGESKIDSYNIINTKRANRYDDFELCKIISERINEADILLHHYGDRFDLRKLNARLCYHGLPPIKPIPTLDTCKMARKHFAFLSNRLDDLGQFLGVGRKVDHPRSLWTDYSFGNDEESDLAAISMSRYCDGDIVLLKAIYDRLKAYSTESAICGSTSDKPSCPYCSSSNLQSRGYAVTKTRKYKRYQCMSCTKWIRATKSEAGGVSYV